MSGQLAHHLWLCPWMKSKTFYLLSIYSNIIMLTRFFILLLIMLTCRIFCLYSHVMMVCCQFKLHFPIAVPSPPFSVTCVWFKLLYLEWHGSDTAFQTKNTTIYIYVFSVAWYQYDLVKIWRLVINSLLE